MIVAFRETQARMPPVYAGRSPRLRVGLVWLVCRPSVKRLRTIDSPHLLSLLDACEQSRIYVCTFDMTNEIGVPTYRVIIHDREELARNPGGFSGSGTHLLLEVALSRALTEAIQARLTLISGSRDDIPPTVYRHARRPSEWHMVSEETGTIPFRRRTEPLPGSFSGWIGGDRGQIKLIVFSGVPYRSSSSSILENCSRTRTSD